jgi:predicted ferric reductase
MYSVNGVGIPAFDIFHLIGIMMAEITISCMLMMIASGWTLSFQDIDFDNNLEFVLPTGAIIIAVHMVLAAMTYVDIDAHHKYHDYSGIQGIFLILLKLILFAFFLYYNCTEKKNIPKRSQDFYRTFTVLGMMYFLIIPVTIITSYLFAPYNRQFYFTMSSHMA